MTNREQMVIDLLCGELQTKWSYCDPSCISCKFYHEESDMGARVSICTHGFGKNKESCDYYMTQQEYLELVRSVFAKLRNNAELLREMLSAKRLEAQAYMAENAKLLKLARDMLPFAQVGMDDSCVTRRCCLYEQCSTTVGSKCLIEDHILARVREFGVEA